MGWVYVVPGSGSIIGVVRKDLCLDNLGIGIRVDSAEALLVCRAESQKQGKHKMMTTLSALKFSAKDFDCSYLEPRKLVVLPSLIRFGYHAATNRYISIIIVYQIGQRAVLQFGYSPDIIEQKLQGEYPDTSNPP